MNFVISDQRIIRNRQIHQHSLTRYPHHVLIPRHRSPSPAFIAEYFPLGPYTCIPLPEGIHWGFQIEADYHSIIPFLEQDSPLKR